MTTSLPELAEEVLKLKEQAETEIGQIEQEVIPVTGYDKKLQDVLDKLKETNSTNSKLATSEPKEDPFTEFFGPPAKGKKKMFQISSNKILSVFMSIRGYF